MIGLKELSEKYKFSEGYFRTLLCRSEFNKFKIPTSNRFTFDNSYEFHEELKRIMKLKKNGYSDWRLRIAFFVLLFNTQIALAQHYEPVIIYNTTGEPQTILKGKIIYDNYGVPKINTPTKRGMLCVRKK